MLCAPRGAAAVGGGHPRLHTFPYDGDTHMYIYIYMGLRTHDLQARTRGAMSCAECCTDEMSTDDIRDDGRDEGGTERTNNRKINKSNVAHWILFKNTHEYRIDTQTATLLSHIYDNICNSVCKMLLFNIIPTIL